LARAEVAYSAQPQTIRALGSLALSLNAGEFSHQGAPS
jgi:hypothetical protein